MLLVLDTHKPRIWGEALGVERCCFSASILGFIVYGHDRFQDFTICSVCMVGLVVFIHKKKLIVILIPILIIGIFIVVSFSPGDH